MFKVEVEISKGTRPEISLVCNADPESATVTRPLLNCVEQMGRVPFSFVPFRHVVYGMCTNLNQQNLFIRQPNS